MDFQGRLILGTDLGRYSSVLVTGPVQLRRKNQAHGYALYLRDVADAMNNVVTRSAAAPTWGGSMLRPWGRW